MKIYEDEEEKKDKDYYNHNIINLLKLIKMSFFVQSQPEHALFKEWSTKALKKLKHQTLK